MRHLLVALIIILIQCCLADEIDRLIAYLQLRTDHGQPGGPQYASCAQFLNRTIRHLMPTASIRQLTYIPGKPIILATLTGTDPTLPALLINSHTDVVPANADQWTKGDPYNPTRDNSRLYARGSQDMKSVGMQYIEALGALLAEGWAPSRTIHLSFVPDEEVGGADGMGQFSQSPEWASLGIGFALDEGTPNPQAKYFVFIGERQTWWVYFTVHGSPGHGATLPEHTATQIAHGIVSKALQFRAKQRARLNDGASMGDVVSVNVAFFEAGVADANQESGYVTNMIPDIARVGFDIRVPPAFSHDDMEKEIASWMLCGDEKCPGASIHFTNKVKIPFITDLDSDAWYSNAFFQGLANAGIQREQLDIGICVGATDARYVRKLGIPAVGFSPIVRTPSLIHKHDEFIEVDTYKKGILIYKQLLRSLSGANEGAFVSKTEL